MNIPINKNDLKNGVIAALDVINTEDFELVVEGDEFALIDNQGANLGGIESDRFENLAQVIDRMDVYHDDYYYEPFEERVDTERGINPQDYDLTAVSFLESDYCCEVLGELNVDKYKQILAEILEAGKDDHFENFKKMNFGGSMRDLLYKEIAYKTVETFGSVQMAEHEGKIYVSDYATYETAEDMLSDLQKVKAEGKEIHFDKVKYKGEISDIDITCYPIPVKEFNSYEEVCNANLSQIKEDMTDLGVSENGQWSFYLTQRELMVAGVSYETIDRQFQEEVQHDNAEYDYEPDI